jgi:hypothetical protein
MWAREAYRFLPGDMYIVETQRTRRGSDKKTRDSTRPYRFGEFDLLAVAMYPSTSKKIALLKPNLAARCGRAVGI